MLALAVASLSLLTAVPVPDRPVPQSAWVGKLIFVKFGGVLLDPSVEPSEPAPMAGAGIPANAIQYRVNAERPKHVQVRSRDGVNAWLRKDDAVLLDDAVAFFTQRLEIKPNDMDALSRRASAWRMKGELDGALKDATEAIRLSPRAAALFNNRAIIYHAKKDYDNAIADYAQALSLSPNYALVYVNRGNMWHTKKEFEQAIADTSRAIEIDPRSPAAFRVRGICWHAKKEYDKALTDLTQALKLDPKFAQAYTDRGLSLAVKKEHAKARADFDEALKLEPNNVVSGAALALFLASCPDERQRDAKRALDVARQAHQHGRSNARAMESLAAAHAELGRFDEATRWQERALQDPSVKTDAEAQRRLELYRQKQPYRQE